MATKKDPRNDRHYRELRDRLKRKSAREGAPCHICKHPIDYLLSYPSPMAFQADHVDAIAAGGHVYGELAPSHASCNGRRQAKPLDATKQTFGKLKTSREW